ncbi:MarR family winged helix-turn-helix transcriptional regulator [Aurantiacibacter flavus]|uniref:MarR family transcriptional regulator n=1 Tax=Aurantiacibacter flavus TaxID=3145232 RepID=A0ABV0CV75_9SPHN
MKFDGNLDMDKWATRFHEHYGRDSRLEKEFLLTRGLVIAARRWTSYVDGLVKQRTGISRAQWQTLSSLMHCEGPVTVGDLSRNMHVKWPTAIRVLKELEALELISSEPDPADARARLIAITKEGERIMEEVREVLDPTRARILGALSDEELVACTRMLGVLMREIGEAMEGGNAGE